MKIITFKPGEIIRSNDKDYSFESPIDENKLLARNLSTGQKEVINILGIQAIEANIAAEKVDLVRVHEKEWITAKKRYEAIKPLLFNHRAPRLYETQAKAFGVHPATLYEWLRKFRETGILSSLLPNKRGTKKGAKKLEEDTEAILSATLKEFYLTDQKRTPTAVYEILSLRCRNAGIEPPHVNTLRNRIAALSGYEKVKGRSGRDEAEMIFGANEGKVTAEFPLAVVQIDHTLLDIILVDDESRMPIGRPWITVAFDVCTRVVLGFYLSLDPPSAMSLGLCLTRAVLKKDDWLMRLKIDVSWPCWGLPISLHLDNAKEFRGEMLRRACDKYGIGTEWRPVAKPNWDAHIERYMKAFAQEMRKLPGTTFSNFQERGDYESDKKSALTIAELERYITLFICNKYHLSTHSAIGKSPLNAWKEGIFGGPDKPGIGLPKMVSSEDRFRLDFMPFEERTINEYGVLIDGIHYYSDVLRPYINSRLPGKYQMRRKFVFRRDPRDISSVHFFDEDNGAYHSIPYRNTSHPAISLWELNAARRHLKSHAKETDNEELIFAAIGELRRIVETSTKETRKKRREVQRKKIHQNNPERPRLANQPKVTKDEDEDLSKFAAFDEIKI